MSFLVFLSADRGSCAFFFVSRCLRARLVFQRYVEAHPHSRAFLKWARWEDKQSQYALAR